MSDKQKGKIEYLNGFIGGKQYDEFSQFKPHINRAKKRGYEIDIDVYYLKKLQESQNGKCIYTGIELELLFYNKFFY